MKNYFRRKPEVCGQKSVLFCKERKRKRKESYLDALFAVLDLEGFFLDFIL